MANSIKITFILLLAFVASIQLIQATRASSSDIFALRKKQNSFIDPIYAFDDIDAHTIAVNSNNEPPITKPRPAREQQQWQTSRPKVETIATKPLAPAPAAINSFIGTRKNISNESTTSANRAGNQKRSSLFEDLALAAPKVASESPRFEPTNSPVIIIPTKVAAYSSAPNRQQYEIADLSIVQAAQQSQQKSGNEKRHWSGLENYLNMLKQQNRHQDDTIYQISQEPAHRDSDLLDWTGGQSWIGSNNQQQQSSKSGPILMLPIQYNVNSQTLQPTNKPQQSSFAFPYEHQSYAAPAAYSIRPISGGATKGQHQSTHPLLVSSYNPTEPTPFILQPQTNVYNRDSNQDLGSLSREELLRRLIQVETKNKQQQQLQQLQQQQQQQQLQQQQAVEQRRYDPTNNGEVVLPTVFNRSPSAIDRQPDRQAAVLFSNDGRVVHQDQTKLQEYLDIQRQQQRYKHQQETFGSIYDSQRMREKYQEEIYCGPRNLVHIRLASTTGTNRNSSASSSATTILNPEQLNKLSQLRIDPTMTTQDVTVQLSAGEFPSHMGIYNGTPGEDNFLCAATWIHDGYALTLATCVGGVSPKILTARFGEWNLNRSSSSNSNDSSTNTNLNQQNQQMFTSSIEEIIIFKGYNKNHSLEHNLALLKFVQPINFIRVPYASPACQKDSRNSLQRAKSCWTPVRNITLSEYFDAEGEGETKEKKNVSMIELPVKLIADDTECFRQNGADLFNTIINHPYYICSADYRKAPWRAKLNQSDYFGSGIYCNDGGNLNLVSLVHPIGKNSPSSVGYMDLNYYKPWMRSVIFAQ